MTLVFHAFGHLAGMGRVDAVILSRCHEKHFGIISIGIDIVIGRYRLEESAFFGNVGTAIFADP